MQTPRKSKPSTCGGPDGSKFCWISRATRSDASRSWRRRFSDLVIGAQAVAGLAFAAAANGLDDRALNRPVEPFGGEVVLAQVVLGAGLHRGDRRPDIILARQHHDRRMLLKTGEQLEGVRAGNVVIEQNAVGGRRVERLPGLLPVFGLGDLVGLTKRAADGPPIDLVVVDHQHAGLGPVSSAGHDFPMRQTMEETAR